MRKNGRSMTPMKILNTDDEYHDDVRNAFDMFGDE